MPKAAKYALVWSAERSVYELYAQDISEDQHISDEHDVWVAWLHNHTSFAFRGQAGQINLLKEARKGGAGYWYAYRRQGTRTLKQYAGRNDDLTIAHLESMAATLARPSESSPSPLAHIPRVPQTTHPPSSQALPLLTPKLQLPRLPSGLVVRERLLRQLDAGLQRKLTLLSAPAGFGKTMLVRQWLEEKVKSEKQKIKESDNDVSLLLSTFCLSPSQIGWISLDQGDNDPMRFWRYVIAACQSFGADIGQEALALLTTTLQPPFDPLTQEMLLTPLLNDLTRCVHHGILVLEDYHAVTNAQIHEAMTFFLSHLPTTLHMIMLTRNEPPLPLARLRAQDDLCALQAADLRFSIDETRLFLQQISAAPFAAETIAQVDAQLEGWAAGLRLLTLTLHKRESPQEVAHVLTTFAGSHRSVLDYFIAEVLDAQPAPVQDFLLRTSVLNRLTGALCDAVLDEGRKTKDESQNCEQSSLVLEDLARANLFLELLDGGGQWYRYHGLFADAMRHEARRRLGDEALRHVLSSASIWYEHNGLLAEAIEVALQVDQAARAAELIEQILGNQRFTFAVQIFAEPQETHTLLRWLEQLPVAVLQQHPVVCLSYAIVLVLALMEGSASRASTALAEENLQMAEAGFRATNDTVRLGELFAFRSLIVKNYGASDESVALAKQALALLPVEDMSWRGGSLSAIASGELFGGRLAMARKLFMEARAISEAIENWGFTRAIIGMLSGVYIEQGELHAAAANMRQTLAEARRVGDRDDIAHAQIGLMQLSYEWNALDAAEQEAREALDIGKQLRDEEFKAQATLMLAQIEHARGHTASAGQQVAAVLAKLQPPQSLRLGWHERAARALQARIHLAAGDLAAVQRWADACSADDTTLPYFQRAREELLMARLRLAQGQTEQALDKLTCCLATAREAGHTRYALEAQALMALAYAANKQVSEARQQLQQALVRAFDQGCIRLFLDEGEPMAALLHASLPTIREPAQRDYLRTLLRAFDAERATRDLPDGANASVSPFSEPLSPQEQRVLGLLSTGHSNPQIAAELIVSVNTVKAHLKNIYRKLNVNNRTEAVAHFSRYEM